MTKSKCQWTVGDLMIAILLASACTLPAAIVGFVATNYICDLVFSDEMSVWWGGFILGPLAALLTAAATFLLVFRKILHYGEHPANGDSN
jgi:hypothetical protein